MPSSTGMLAALPITPVLTEFTDCMDRRRAPRSRCSKPFMCWHLSISQSPFWAQHGSLSRHPNWRSTRLGRDAFLHPSVPEGWWEEYVAMAKREQDPGVMMARSSLMGCTLTETVRMLEPIGIDRWPIELSHKFGMRDALTCSVGRRWLVSYWSSKPLQNILTQPGRILLFAAASFAALRLEQLIDHDPRWMGKTARITPRELAVLRLISLGKTTDETARLLGLGEETVGSLIPRKHRANSAFGIERTPLVTRSDRT